MVYAKRQVLEVVLGVVKTVGLKLPMVGIVPTNHIYCISVARSYSGAPTGSVLRQTSITSDVQKEPAEDPRDGRGCALDVEPASRCFGYRFVYPIRVGTIARTRCRGRWRPQGPSGSRAKSYLPYGR